MTEKQLKELEEDAQYLEEFYYWNKARHPEWDGEYVLEIVKTKREQVKQYEEARARNDRVSP